MNGCLVLCLSLALFFSYSQKDTASPGDYSSLSSSESLFHKYYEVEKKQEKDFSPGLFTIESSVNNNTSRVDIYGVTSYPFNIVQSELLVPSNWCQIILSHHEIRACTYKKMNDTWLLTIYNVNNFSKPLEAAYQMAFMYRISKLQPLYFDIVLTAQEGPSHSMDHQIRLEAMPIGNKKTFIHLHYSFNYSTLGYILMKMFGGSKIGFSIIDTDRTGNPVYVKELRGTVERDVACHYLAILAYFDTLNIHVDQRFERRISRWIDLTTPFEKQLPEIKKQEYIGYKRQDWKNQQSLQSNLVR